MTAVLGIDAAWSPGNPSGVALVVDDGKGWTCKSVNPSYARFIAGPAGDDRWRHPPGGEADVPALIGAAAKLAEGHLPAVIAIDMPLATEPFNGRRSADRKTSEAFGRFKCAVHSPTPTRPGQLGRRFTAGLAQAGYTLATAETTPATCPAAIEVYPHAAIVRLMGLEERFKYKVSRSLRLWPGVDVEGRIGTLLRAFHKLKRSLDTRIAGIEIPLPSPAEIRTLASLKPFEDALDALVCAWAGTCYVEGRAKALGDGTAAIWVPAG